MTRWRALVPRIVAALLLPLTWTGAFATTASPAATAADTADAATAAAPALIDAAGRSVSLAAPATRIVALAPHIVENLYSIGAGAQIVGAVDYSDYPAEAEAIPRVGGIAGISLERIVALQPDLVIGWLSGTDSRIIAAIDELSIPYYLDEIRSLDDLHRSLTHLGLLAGRRREAAAAVRTVQLAAAAQARVGDAERPTVFLQLWDQPLQSVGAQHLLTDVIERCGGRSVTALVPGLAPRIELEAVIAADPDLIIVESTEQARHWSRFPELTALRSGRIHTIDPDLMHRPTLRLLQGMQTICEHVDAARARAAD